MSSFTYKLTNPNNSHVDISDCGMLHSMSLEKSPTAWSLYQISRKSIQPFSSSHMRTHDVMGEAVRCEKVKLDC
jgi:hypothetical protein